MTKHAKGIATGAVATLTGFFILHYLRHRKERTNSELTPDERRNMEIEADRSAIRAATTPHISFSGKISNVGNDAMALLRRLVKPDE